MAKKKREEMQRVTADSERKGKNSRTARKHAEKALRWGRVRNTLLLMALFFLMVCVTVPGTIKVTAMLLMLATVAVAVFHVQVLGERLNWLSLVAALWVLWCGISTLYAVSGKFALAEFLKVLVAFCVFTLIVTFERGSIEEIGRGTAFLLESCTALFSFFSIDFLSTRIFSTPFFWVMGRLCNDYDGLYAVESGVRMTSVMGNPNIFAGCVGIGVLLSLGLATTEAKVGMKRVHLVCLGINSLAFLLAFSMGGSGAIALAFLVYLILEQKDRRASLLILMVETLLLTVTAAFPIYLTAFDGWRGVDPVPLLCMAAVAVALCVLDEQIGQRLSKRMAGNEKAVFALLGAVMAVVGVYAVLSLQMAGPARLGQGETLRRAAYLDAGSYDMALEASGAMNVVVESQDQQETMMHTSTVLYAGPAEHAEFTVPDDSLVVYFNLIAAQDLTVSRVSYQGPGSGSLKLEYKLLPGFVANRLQGLFANQNAIQRLVFFQDGLKLSRQSPLIGLGMGAFENSLFSVQSFNYETKYAHNHYIQAMVETGVVGLLLFVGTLVLGAAAVLLARKSQRKSPLTAVLGAALVFMAGHAAVEVVFSSGFYLPMAFGVLALISLCCGAALPPLPISGKKVRGRVVWALPAFILVYAALLAGNLYAGSLARTPYYPSLEMAINLDRFEWADHALSYVYSALAQEETDPLVVAQRDRYIKRLEGLHSNTIPYYLAECYFSLERVDDAFRMLEEYTSVRASQQQAWQQSFQLAMTCAQESEEYISGLRSLYQSLLDWNEANMGSITLDETTTAFVEYMTAQ